mgnify:CR=1 FL=1
MKWFVRRGMGTKQSPLDKKLHKLDILRKLSQPFRWWYLGVNKMSEDKRTMICPKCGAENYSWRSRCQTCNTLLHEEDIKMVKFRRRDPLKSIALISGVIGAGALTFFMWFIAAFASGRITRPIDWLFVIGTGLFALGSIAVAWKWPLIGGILLILEGVGPMGLIVWSAIQTHSVFSFFTLFFLIPGLPSLASGAIFLFLWREES